MSSEQLARDRFTAHIVVDILLTIVTCGIYNVYIQYRQIQAVNAMLGEPRYDFFRWAIFTFITCGLYHVYHEYLVTKDLMKYGGEHAEWEPLVAVFLSVAGFSWLVDALQQNTINKHFGVDRAT